MVSVSAHAHANSQEDTPERKKVKTKCFKNKFGLSDAHYVFLACVCNYKIGHFDFHIKIDNLECISLYC